MFALPIGAVAASLIRRKADLGKPSSGRVVKRVVLRKSPRRKPKKMPTVISEQLQFTIVPEVLEVRILKGPGRIPRDDKLYKYFTIEGWFNYPDLSLYYGPSNITHIIQFVERVEAFKAQSPDKTVCLIIKINSDQALNSVLCVSAFLVLMKEVHPKLAVLAINPVLKELQTLHYKTEGEEISDDIPITILDCLQGLKVFMSLNLLDLEHLDVDEVMMRENPLHGDMNWVVPDKILAFAGPTNEVYSVEEFSEYAKMKHVNTVVRLNRVRYDAEVLKTKGIQHFDMFIHDGNIPTLQQIDEFYGIAERAWNTGAMAVHCRAGLGRTGTMIATFLIKKFNLQASDVIAYLRMMRPGSVLGMQARYLDSIQYMLRGESIPDDAKAYLSQYYPDQFHTIEVSSGSEAEGQQVDSNQADDHFAEPAIRAH